jgi:hypothetical protein
LGFRAENGIETGPKNSCASSKVATAGGAIGGRAGTGGHFQFCFGCRLSTGLTFGRQPHPQRVGLYTSPAISQRNSVTNLTKLRFRRQVDVLFPTPYTTRSFPPKGQVAQLVERGPEKAGVGGSTPSLATISFNNLATAKKRVRTSRANNSRTSVLKWPRTLGSCSSPKHHPE